MLNYNNPPLQYKPYNLKTHLFIISVLQNFLIKNSINTAILNPILIETPCPTKPCPTTLNCIAISQKYKKMSRKGEGFTSRLQLVAKSQKMSLDQVGRRLHLPTIVVTSTCNLLYPIDMAWFFLQN